MSDTRSLIESAVGGNKEDLRRLLLAYNDQLELHNQSTGTAWLNPTSGAQKPSTTPPPAATTTAAGANGNITVQITNPSQAAKATIYHEISYSPVKNFSQGVTTLPPTPAGSVTIPAPGQAPFVRVRSSYDGSTWNSHQLIQNSAVNAGLQSSAASEPAVALNNWNYATVVGQGAPGQVPLIQVYGSNGPYNGYTAGRGTTRVSRPSATILNTDFTENQIVAYDGKQFHISPILPGVMHDSWEPVGQALTNGTPGGGGNRGGNGARLTAI
jgi:hypothetical protein